MALCLFVVGFSNIFFYLLSLIIIAVYFLVIVCVKVALKKYTKAHIESAPAAAAWDPNQFLNENFEDYYNDSRYSHGSDYRSQPYSQPLAPGAAAVSDIPDENTPGAAPGSSRDGPGAGQQRHDKYEQLPPSKLSLNRLDSGSESARHRDSNDPGASGHNRNESEYDAEKAGVSKEELAKLNKKHKSIKQNLVDKGHSRQKSLNAAEKKAKSLRMSSKQVDFICCFGACRIGLTKFWQLQTFFSALTFWGSIATVIMLPNEYFQYDTVPLSLFVLITCWWNPMFYSTTRRKARGCKKCWLYLYWASGYVLGFIVLALVAWYFYDCDFMNSTDLSPTIANGTTLNTTTTASPLVNDNGTGFNVTSTEDEIWVAVCNRASFANDVNLGTLTLFPETRTETKIDAYSREYSSFQDAIMLVALLASIGHFFPATGYLFYSAPIAFCLSHIFSILLALFVPIIQLQEIRVWQYYFIGSEPQLLNNATVDALVVFLVTFAIFLSWSGMCLNSVTIFCFVFAFCS